VRLDQPSLVFDTRTILHLRTQSPVAVVVFVHWIDWVAFLCIDKDCFVFCYPVTFVFGHFCRLVSKSSSPMPLCFCFSHGCNLDTDCDGKPVGVLLGTRLVEQHRQDDRVAGLLRAEKLAEKAVGLQRQRVSEHILAETLADSLTCFVEKPGGRLWSRNSSSSPTDSLSPFSRGLSSPSDPLPPTSNDELPRSRDMEVLSSLKCLEAEANDLILKTTKQLKNVAVPPSARPNTAFPLVSNLHTVEDLQNRLTAISLKSPLVLSCKAKLTAGLGCIEDKLKTAKRQWIHSLDSMRVRQTPKHGEAFSTGMFPPFLYIFSLITCQHTTTSLSWRVPTPSSR
jgi:hypothetical protein